MNPNAEWAVVVLDPTAGGAEQNVRAYWDAEKSVFQPIAHYRPEQANWRLRFESTVSLNIREGYPWMAGYRDPATRYWDPDQPVYCGQIGQQTGSGVGRDHILLDLLDDWSVAFGDTGIIHWPNNDFLSVYPANHSVKTWIGGTVATGAPFDGLLATVFDPTRVDISSGIDPVFDTLIIDNTYMPSIGKSVVFGVGQFCTSKDFLDTMVAVSRFISPGVDAVAFMEPAVNPADPTQIWPRFRLIDRNDTTGPVDAVYSIDPAFGEYGIEQPATHNRDLRPAKGRIIVVGKGGDPTLPGNPLVYVDYYVPEHSDQYPAWLNRTPGRILYIVDDRIETLAAALQIARATEALVYGPAGRLVFRSRRFTVPGRIVQLFWPQEGQVNTRFVVAGVKAVPNPGSPLFEITLGVPAPDLRFIIDRAVNSGLNDTTPITLTAMMAPGLGAAATPKTSRQPVDAAPHTTAQATITPRDRTVVAHRVKGTQAVKPGADTTTTPYANLAEWEQAVGPVKTTVDANGRPHPHLYFINLVANGTTPGPVIVDPCNIARVFVKGTGSVTLVRNGSTVTTALAGSTAGILHTLTPAQAWSAGDDMDFIVSGIAGTLKVMAGEA